MEDSQVLEWLCYLLEPRTLELGTIFFFASLWIEGLHSILDVVNLEFILENQVMSRGIILADICITQWQKK